MSNVKSFCHARHTDWEPQLIKNLLVMSNIKSFSHARHTDWEPRLITLINKRSLRSQLGNSYVLLRALVYRISLSVCVSLSHTFKKTHSPTQTPTHTNRHTLTHTHTHKHTQNDWLFYSWFLYCCERWCIKRQDTTTESKIRFTSNHVW